MIQLLLLYVGSVSCLLVNTFYPLSSQETVDITSSDAATLMGSSFLRSGSAILNQIPALSYNDWKNSNRGWIIVSGLDDYPGQFKTADQDVLFNVYKDIKDSGVYEIPLTASSDIQRVSSTLSSELSALRLINPYSYSNYVIVIKGLEELQKDSDDYKNGLKLLEQELDRFKQASKDKPLLLSTISEWKSLKLVTRQVNSCAQTESECLVLYNNCSYHGKCESRKLGKNKDCWICSCISIGLTDDTGKLIPGFESPRKWAGSQCEFEDISVPFQILFWTSVALLLVLMMVIGMMMNTDSGDSFTGNQYEHRLKEE